VSVIASVEACSVVVPLTEPVSFATRRVEARHYTLVRLRDEEGAEGIGFCYGGNFGGSLVTAAVRQLIAPIVAGRRSVEVRGLWEEVYRATLLHGRAGVVMRALSAVDIALWDLNARRASLPLWEYLGAATTDPVPAYASGGYYRDGKNLDHLAQEMKHYLSMGFRAVKMKVGKVSVQEDADRISAVRDAVGSEVRVMLDANNAWTHFGDALEALRLWEPYNPYWIEEPFSPDDIENHARLVRATPILVATGEIEAGRWRNQQLLLANAVHILQTDATVCGGITEYQTIAHTAASSGVTMCPHAFHHIHLHLVGSTANAGYVEYFPDDRIVNFGRLTTQQIDVTPDGHLRLPKDPGLGFDLDPEAVESYTEDGWR
jgi:L-alanine-DL-glutamate epimerase-like enolase superfamily enzyme